MEPIDRVELCDIVQPNGYFDKLNHNSGDKLLCGYRNNNGHRLHSNGIGMCYGQSVTGCEPGTTIYHMPWRCSYRWWRTGTGK